MFVGCACCRFGGFWFCCVLRWLFACLFGLCGFVNFVLGLVAFVIFLWLCLAFDAGVLAGSAGGLLLI